MEKEKYRNMTISLKVAAEEKIMLKRLAEKYNVTLSEFLYNIVMCFKGLYAFIGRLTPREEKLAENLRLEKKKTAKLEIRTENAEFRVKMEIENRVKTQNENHELIYQLKEEKAINTNQAQLIIEKDKIIESLQKEVKSLSKSKRDQHMKYTAVGVLGLFTGGILSKKLNFLNLNMKKFSFLFALVHSFVFANSPVINLNGEAYIEIYVGDVFIDPGATAFDQEDGDLSSMIQISGSVDTSISNIYTLIYSVSDSDGNTTQTIRDVYVMLFVDAGPDLVFCEDEYVDINEASASDGVSVNWIILVGYGQLLNPDSLSPTYIYSEQDIIDGEVILVLEATDEAGNANYDELLISFVSNPIVNIGEDAEINEGDTFQLNDTYVSNISSFFWTSSGSGYFNQIGSLSPTYIPSDSDIANGQVTLTLGGGSISPCTMDSYDAMVLTIHQNSSSPPVITIQGSNPITVEVNATYIDPGATAIDDTDGDLTSQIIINGEINTNILGQYIIIYSVTDSHGNTTSVNRAVNVVDTTPPVISLNGDSTIYLELGSTYTELGATATDNYDGNLSSQIFLSGSVDTSTVGTYYISYNATDSSGNVANQKVRTVIIEDIYPSLEIINTAIIYDDDVDGYNGLGDTIEYTIAVENTGNINLSDVYITDNLTALNGDSLSLTTGPPFVLDSLAPGVSHPFTATYVISQQAVDAGGVSFTAIATASTPNGFEDVTTVSNSTNIETYTNSSLAVTKEVAAIIDDGDGFNGSGDIIDYTITITNTGNLTLNNVTIQDSLYYGYGNFISELTPIFVGSNKAGSQQGVLQVGETSSYSAQYTIDQAASDSEWVRNTVTVFAYDPFGISPQDSAFVDIFTGASASIEVLKTWELYSDLDSDGIVDDGDTIRFIVSVKNTGNVEVTGITLEDTFSDGAGNLVSFDNGTTTDPRPLNFTGADQSSSEGLLLVGETATYESFYTVTTAVYNTGLVSNTVTAIGDSPQGTDDVSDVSDDGDDLDGNTENDPTRITMGSNPDVLVTKTQAVTENDGTLGVGDIVTYTISISNQGNVPLSWSASDIIDVMTDGYGNTLSLTSGPTWSYSNKGSPMGSIVDGETAFYTATYVIEQAAVDSGVIQNRVMVNVTTPDGTIIEATADGDNDDYFDADGDGNPENDPLVLFFPPQVTIEVIKTALVIDNDGDGKNGIGDTIEYTITVENSSNVTLSNLSLTDTLTDLNGNSLALTSGPTFISNSSSSTEGTLQPGETATYVATYVITQSAVDAGGVSNTAAAACIAPDGTSISDVSDDGDTGPTDTGDDPTITILTSQPLIDNENILLNGNVYITKSNGLIIKSGDDCYRIKVNNGNVVAEPVNCE